MSETLTKVPVLDPATGEPVPYSPAKSAEKAAKQTGMSLAALAITLIGVVAGSPEAQAAAGAYWGDAMLVGLVFAVVRYGLGHLRDRAAHRGPSGELVTKVETR